MKYVLVTGGVESGSAKGVTALTVDLLLKAFTPIKIDPYLNTEEGPANVCVIQLGGTRGDDIESDPFIKALGQFSYRVGRWNFCCVFFSVVPVLNVVGEQKLWGLRLRGLGSTPDILVCCLGDEAPEENVKEKIAQSCHVPLEYIFALSDVSNIRHILLLLEAHLAISKVLNLARDDDKHFVDERHPHIIYEVNPDMVERQEKADLSLAAKDEIGKRIEVCFKLSSLE